MGIRTGKNYIESLRDGRQMWIDGELVKDVTKDRRFAAAAYTMAELYDMNFDGEVVGAIAIVGTTQYVHEPVEPEQLKLLLACAKAMSLKLNSTAYEGQGVPSLKDFIFD